MTGGNKVEGSVGEVGDSYQAVCSVVTGASFLEAAEAAQIVWGKVGKYPHWPAQVLPPGELAKRKDLANKRPKVPAVPVMFYGEYTVAWITQKAVLTWGQGIQQNCHLKSDPNLRLGVEEVADFLAASAPRRAPKAWWCSAPRKGAEVAITAPLQAYIPPATIDNAAKEAPAAVVAPTKALVVAAKPAENKDKKINKTAVTKAAGPVPVPVAKKSAVPSKSPAAAVAKAAVASESAPQAGSPSGEKIRWSARDVLKPLVNRLKRLFPQLADEPTPSATQELFEWVHGYFGNAIDIDQQLKGKTPSDLIAEMFSRQIGKTINSADVSACLSASHIDMQALKAMGVDPRSWDVPLAGGPPRKQQPAPTACPVTKTPALAAAPAAASGAVQMLTDADAPFLQVVNGRLVMPSKPRARTGSYSTLDGAGGLESEDGRSMVPALVPVQTAVPIRLEDPPNYVHVKQNVWVSRPRPKRLKKDEISVCNCPRPAALPARPSPLAPLEMEVDIPELGLKSEPAVDVEMKDETVTEVEALDMSDEAIVKRMVTAIFAPYLAANARAVTTAAPTAAPLVATALEITALSSAVESVEDQQRPPSRAGRNASAGLASAIAAARGPVRARPPSTASVPADTSAPEDPRDGCGEGCLNRLSFIHCDTRTCPAGERCSNRPFHQLPCPNMEVFLTKDKGWGVRAAAFIPKGHYVVEYAGEVVDDYEMKVRMEAARQRQEPHFYMMEMAPGLVIDARPKGNIARLLNSSCDPNCETQKWHDAATGEIRVGIFTLRDVAPGEELVYDYHFQQLFGQDAGGEYQCRCGAAKCRGTMDATLDRAADCGRRIEIWWGGEEVYYAGTVTSYSSVTGKHTILYDDGDVEKIDLTDRPYRWLDDGKPGSKIVPTATAAAELLPALQAVMEPTWLAHQQNGALQQSFAAQAPAAANQELALPGPLHMPVLPKRGRGRPPGPLKHKKLKVVTQSPALPAELYALVHDLLPEEGKGVAALSLPALHAVLGPVLAVVYDRVGALVVELAAKLASRPLVENTANGDVEDCDMDMEVDIIGRSTHSSDSADGPAVVPTEGTIVEGSGKMVLDDVCVDVEMLEASSGVDAQNALEVDQEESVHVDLQIIEDFTAEPAVVLKLTIVPAAALMKPTSGAAVEDNGNTVLPAVPAPIGDIQANKVQVHPLQDVHLMANGSSPYVPCPEPRFIAYLRRQIAAMDAAAAAAHCGAVQERLGALRKFLDTHALSCASSVVPVDNPGAQAVAGRLHGNGKGGAPGRSRRAPVPAPTPASVSGRGRKRQRKIFGEDFVEDVSDQDAPVAVPLEQRPSARDATVRPERSERSTRARRSRGEPSSPIAPSPEADFVKEEEILPDPATVAEQPAVPMPQEEEEAPAPASEAVPMDAAIPAELPAPEEKENELQEVVAAMETTRTETSVPEAAAEAPLVEAPQTAFEEAHEVLPTAATAPVTADKGPDVEAAQETEAVEAPEQQQEQVEMPEPAVAPVAEECQVVAALPVAAPIAASGKGFTGGAAGVDALAAIAAAELPDAAEPAPAPAPQQQKQQQYAAPEVVVPRPHVLVPAPHAGYRRSGPTPGSTGLPARTILVAKRLTNSDVSKGRILLPRAAVEANLSFAIGRACSLTAKDHLANSWEFTLQSWANGLESRRVYVLEHAGEYIKHHALKLDDVIGISCTEDEQFLVEYNTDEVCSAAETQQAARGQGAPAPPLPLPQGSAPAGMNPLIQHNSGRCTRSEHCNKPAGHPGFCMRTPAAGRGRRPGANAPRPPPVAAEPVLLPKRKPSIEDIMRAKRRRRPTAKATSSSYRLSTEEEDNSYSEMDESDEDSDWGDEERTKLAMAVAAPSEGPSGVSGDGGGNNSGPQGPYQGPAFTPDMDPAGPRIFQMAPDMNAHPYGMRSPFIRPLARQNSSMQPSSSGAASPSLGSAGDAPLPNVPLAAPTQSNMQQGQPGSIELMSSGPSPPALGDLLPDVPALSLPEPMAAPTLPSIGGVDALPASGVAGGPGGDNGINNGTAGGGGQPGSSFPPQFMLQAHQGMLPVPQLSVPLFGGPPPANAPGVSLPGGIGAAGGGGVGGALGLHQHGADHGTDFDCMSFLNNNNIFNSMGGTK